MSKSKAQVVRWVTWKEAERIRREVGEDFRVCSLAELRRCIKRNRYKFNGWAHQSDDVLGVPVFENGKVSMFSMREWGDIMCRVWGGYYAKWAYWNEFDEKVPGRVSDERE